jgi:hypothetical protein
MKSQYASDDKLGYAYKARSLRPPTLQDSKCKVAKRKMTQSSGFAFAIAKENQSGFEAAKPRLFGR